MRRFSILIILAVVLLCSCSQNNNKQNFKPVFPFESRCEITFDTKSYVADIVVNSKDNVSITFVSPSRLNGITLKYIDGKAYITYNGIDIDIEGEYASDNGLLLIRHIFSVSEKSFSGAAVVSRSGVKYCLENYKCDGADIRMLFCDNESVPSIIEADINGRKITLTFVNNN